MRHGSIRMGVLGLLLLAAGNAPAADITFSGTVSYGGPYSGDTLFVAVLDTAGTEDAEILVLEAYAVGGPPFAQPYTLTFDNTGVSPMLLVAAFLDVDGGGVGNVTGNDVLGWFAGAADPIGIASTSSQGNLDFALPQAEIHGTLTFAPGQTSARLEISQDSECGSSGFRPAVDVDAAGAYSIIGIYAGTYCLHGEGSGDSGGLWICYGDPTCVSPTTITLGPTEVVNGIDLDFNDVVPVEGITWGRLKSRYMR